MARLLKVGNPLVRRREQRVTSPRNQPAHAQIAEFDLFFVDELKSKHQPIKRRVRALLPLSCSEAQLKELAITELLRYAVARHLNHQNFHFFTSAGQEVLNFDPDHDRYFVSSDGNIAWLFDLNHFTNPNKETGSQQTILTEAGMQSTSIQLSPMATRQQTTSQYDYLIPQVSFRSRCLRTSNQRLDSVAESLKNYKLNSDPFAMTSCKVKTTLNSFFSNNKTKPSLPAPCSKTKIEFDPQEQYFLDNLQKCEEELEEYIQGLKRHLSPHNDPLEKIIKFYEDVSYPTPRSRALEFQQMYSSNFIGNQLNKILKSQKKEEYLRTTTHLTNLKRIERQTPQLSLLNIPQLQLKYKLSRNQLYHFFSLFKVLHLITAIQQEFHKNPLTRYRATRGVSYEVYRDGIETIQDQSENIAKGIFEIIDNRCRGFLDWQQFIYLMSSVQAKTREQRIDLFVRIADIDKNGVLCFKEVVRLSQQNLMKFIHTEDMSFIKEMSHFFARLIFDSVGVDCNKEIEFNQLKEIIRQGHPNSDLLCMFCGAE